jgi:orotate phosphoribosyltransferase
MRSQAMPLPSSSRGPPTMDWTISRADLQSSRLLQAMPETNGQIRSRETSPSAELARRIHKRSFLTGEFTLRSGGQSSFYIGKYAFEADPALLRDIAEAMLPLLPKDIDALAGLELGGIPIATVLSQLSGLPTLFVRKQAKAYGTCQLAEGGETDRRLAIIEDVVTSGGQVIESCAALRERGASIRTVLCVLDREAGGTENLAQAGLELRSLFTMSQLQQASTG